MEGGREGGREGSGTLTHDALVLQRNIIERV